MPSVKFIKFWPITILFFLGLIAFWYVHSIMPFSYWYMVIWIHVFVLVQVCGAYFIGLNFHLNSINSLQTTEKKVLLTFDDGPCNPYTEQVLNVLRKHRVKAVFFVIGKNIQGNEAVLKQMVAEGHTIGNHSFSHHRWIDLWSSKKITADFQACQKLIEQYEQPNRLLFRPPYGVTNPNIAKAVKQLKLQSIGWNIRSYDTSIKELGKVQQRILAGLKPGAIILLHDRLEFMPELLESLIPAIKEKGYEFEENLSFRS